MNDYLKSLPKKRMGAAALLLDNKGRILMLKPSYKDHWTIPGGVVEKDESPKEGCNREIEEEIGIKVRVKKLLAVSYNTATADKDENLQWIFYGGILQPSQVAQIRIDGKEIIQFKFVDSDAALEIIEPGMREKLTLYKRLLRDSGAIYLENWSEVF